MTNLYSILGVVPTADATAIRAAAKALSIKYHPDRAPAFRRDEYEERFKEIQKAKLVLTDPEKRRRYDIELWNASQIHVHGTQRPHPFPGQQQRPPTNNMAPDPVTAFREQAEQILRNAGRKMADAATSIFGEFINNVPGFDSHYQRRDPFDNPKRRRGGR